MTSLMLAGLGIATSAFAIRLAMRSFKQIQQHASKLPKNPKFATYYYKGGFEPQMTRREAGLILGVSPAAPKNRIAEAYKRLIVLNHPDRAAGCGSPYLAQKIIEANEYLMSDGKSNKKSGL